MRGLLLIHVQIPTFRKNNCMDRRNFVKTSSVLGMGALILPNSLFAYDKMPKRKVRLGFIATGLRGQSHIAEMLKRDDVEIVAFADPEQRMLDDAQKIVVAAGRKKAVEYSNGDYDYRNLLKRDDIDAVFICSPWEWHLAHGTEAMRAGKIVGMEVCGAMSLDECWEYVKVYEETKVPIMTVSYTHLRAHETQ